MNPGDFLRRIHRHLQPKPEPVHGTVPVVVLLPGPDGRDPDTVPLQLYVLVPAAPHHVATVILLQDH